MFASRPGISHTIWNKIQVNQKNIFVTLVSLKQFSNILVFCRRNVADAMLSLLAIGTQDWVSLMHKLSATPPLPRVEGAVLNVTMLLMRRNNITSMLQKQELLGAVRKYLPVCTTTKEMRILELNGVVSCSAEFFGVSANIPCKGTCGSVLAYFICPIVTFFIGTLIIQVVNAVLLSAMKKAQLFAGTRELVSRSLTKKRFKNIVEAWKLKAVAVEPVITKKGNGRCRIIVKQVRNLKNTNVFSSLDVYVTVVVGSVLRKSSVKSGSLDPEWPDEQEFLFFPKDPLPMNVRVRVYDRYRT